MGGNQNTLKGLQNYIDIGLDKVFLIMTDYQTAEMIKYVCNNFFATKVSFLNEMKLISDAVNAKWDDVVEDFLEMKMKPHTKFPAQMENMDLEEAVFLKIFRQ